MNKKIVILIVVIECVLAIFLAGIWGRTVESLFSKVTCSDIYFVDENGQRYEENAVIEVELEYDDEGVATYKLNYVIEPADISNSQVTFYTNDPVYVTVSVSGVVYFYKSVHVDITIMAADGSGKKATISLVPKENTDVIIDPGFFD